MKSFKYFLAFFSLEGGKVNFFFLVFSDNELNAAVTKITHSIKENYVSGVGHGTCKGSFLSHIMKNFLHIIILLQSFN